MAGYGAKIASHNPGNSHGGGDMEYDAEDMAAEELIECLSVPKDKQEKFKMALKSYVEACVMRAMEDDASVTVKVA